MYEHPEAFTRSGWHWFQIIGRLGADASRQQLQARLQPAFHDDQQERVRWIPTMPDSIRKQFLEAQLRVHDAASGASEFRLTFARPLWIVLGVAAAILLIACANVASLLLARSTARAAEIAMRISLGASRARLIRQLLTESLLLSAIAGVIGWLLARSAAPAIVHALSQQNDPVQLVLAMDTRVLAFCIAVSTLAAVSFGLVPAWQASGTKPILALRSDGGQAFKLRIGRFFVAVQVAFAFCLVMTGAAFLLTLHHLQEARPGFDPRGVAVLKVSGTHPEELRRRIMLHSAADGVAAAERAVFGGVGWAEQILVPGRPPSDQEEIFLRVSPGYFQTLKTPLLQGRDFTEADHGDSRPVPVIVNQAFAHRYFEGDAIGREFERPEGTPRIRHVVVGVAANAFYTDLRRGAEPIVYLPFTKMDAFTLYVRTRLPLGDLLKLVDSDAHNISPGMRVREVTSLEALVGGTLLRERLLAGISGVFGLLGLALAAIGLFGVLNYSVVKRTKEIGVRAALGAQPREVVWLILRDLSGTVGGGLGVGMVVSLGVLAGLRSLLFGVQTIDPTVIGVAGLLFIGTALAAAGWPARRAASIDPVIALRVE